MCTKPLIALDYGVDPDTGKHIIKMKRVPVDYDLKAFMNLYPKDMVKLIPCGSCPECILKYRKEWSIRCVAESLLHIENCFISLTYDEQHYHGANKEDLRDFLKSLRNYGYKVRYFACGEHGQFGRFHYHACLFGYIPKDLKYHSQSKSGEVMYSSEFLEKIWDKGFVRVQQFNNKTAQYVAGYVSKKLGNKDGFLMMSTHPGLGYGFYELHKWSISEFDKLYLGLNPLGNAVPRYFLKQLEKDGYDLSYLINQRLKKSIDGIYNDARHHGFDYIEKVFKYKSFFAEKRLSKIWRSA